MLISFHRKSTESKILSSSKKEKTGLPNLGCYIVVDFQLLKIYGGTFRTKILKL